MTSLIIFALLVIVAALCGVVGWLLHKVDALRDDIMELWGAVFEDDGPDGGDALEDERPSNVVAIGRAA